MNLDDVRGIFTPVSTVLSEITARFESLQLAVPSSVLYEHTQQAVQDLSKVEEYRPTFFETSLVAVAIAGKTRAAKERLRAEIHHLELAAAYCAAAVLPLPKPLAHVLGRARCHCCLFDATQQRNRTHNERVRAARSKGGQNRHADNVPAQSEAARLLREKAPPGGWLDPKTAANAILEELRSFIHQHRIKLVTGDHLITTVIRWIRRWITDVPEIAAAFANPQLAIPTRRQRSKSALSPRASAWFPQ